MRSLPWPLIVLLAGCAVPPREAPPPSAPMPLPAEVAPFEPWPVESARLSVRVYRDGPMQRLGHNHLITSDALEGTIRMREPLVDSGFELRLPLDSLVVDDAAARAAAGPEFAAPVPDKDREATRRNMLGEGVLAAARQDAIGLVAEGLSGESGAYTAQVRVTLAGSERAVTVPFTVSVEGDRLEAEATLTLSHADLGLLPFTAAMGALRVRDDIGVELRLVARRAT
jgi:hypothetical protein